LSKQLTGSRARSIPFFRTRFSSVLLKNYCTLFQKLIPCSSSIPATMPISDQVAASLKPLVYQYLLKILLDNSNFSQNASIQKCANVYHVVSNATPLSPSTLLSLNWTIRTATVRTSLMRSNIVRFLNLDYVIFFVQLEMFENSHRGQLQLQ